MAKYNPSKTEINEVNTVQIIIKRANITHERPDLPVAGGLVSQNKRLFLHKTNDWKEGRRLIHQLMLGADSKSHGQIVDNASLGLLKAYLDQPESWYAHHYRYAIAIMHKIVTDLPIQKSTAELDELQYCTSTFLSSINSSFVDFLPLLARLPEFVQFWRPYWKAIGVFHYNVFKKWWINMKPFSNTSWVSNTVMKDFSGTEDRAIYLTMFVIMAGADNPRMTMNSWSMACLAYPEAMEKARKELESVCGTDGHRLPTFGDLASLPYVCAVVKEVLRWRPTVPLIPQRVLVKDLEFEGYKFPAGTEFLVNSFAVCGDGFENSRAFRPQRWLESKERGGGIDQDLWHFAFSGGRRSCVGYKLAQQELFLAFARLLYCFDFSPAGEFDDTKLNAFSPGEPFPVKATVRSPAYERLIREEAVKCDIWGC